MKYTFHLQANIFFTLISIWFWMAISSSEQRMPININSQAQVQLQNEKYQKMAPDTFIS